MEPSAAATPEPSDATHTPTTARERDLLRRLAAGTAGVVGDAFLRALVHHLAAAFGAELAFLGEFLPEPASGRVRVLASWQNGVELPEGYEFDLDETMPCSAVAATGMLVLPFGTCERYPGDRYVRDFGLDSYLGVALPGADGSQVGYAALMSSRPLEPDEDELAVLRIFAARAAAEIERRRHQATLRTRDAEVAAARSRVLDAADGERQRIGRDLHDGAQQRVVALGHLIGIARRKLGDDLPPDAAELLERAQEEARLATDELRELARGLHPAGLTEKGLAPALEALAARSPVPVEIGRLPERRLPAPVELSAFYLASEALTNAVKYANATRVRVDVFQRLAEAVAVVADDGDGGADPLAGSGLRGLRDRIAALGGELTIDSPPGGGTRLEATIPLAPWRSAHEPFLEFGHADDGGRGERNIHAVISGRKTLSVTLAREWELEGGPPRVGQRLPVMDFLGRRRATVEVVSVASVPFSDIDDDWLEPEDVGTETLDGWRSDRRGFYATIRDEMAMLLGEPGWRFTDEEPMTLLWYRPVSDDDGTDDGAS
ncbi:MAG TPA: histidine kinase [Baekduia sp.]|uniref:histidine kinase n=1 Tax=Baekduia sp. TaxID=2600305 RepID=UPI002D134B95|nr:histidine kinase [Baekduia sp.]HMJ36900.1 histidine kinase [Baekduia sp.]